MEFKIQNSWNCIFHHSKIYLELFSQLFPFIAWVLRGQANHSVFIQNPISFMDVFPLISDLHCTTVDKNTFLSRIRQ